MLEVEFMCIAVMARKISARCPSGRSAAPAAWGNEPFRHWMSRRMRCRDLNRKKPQSRDSEAEREANPKLTTAAEEETDQAEAQKHHAGWLRDCTSEGARCGANGIGALEWRAVRN